jgi:hypothetical protein
MPLRVGWHLAVQGFPPGITQECHLKPPGPDLMGGGGGGRGGGHFPLFDPMEKHLSLLNITHER